MGIICNSNGKKSLVKIFDEMEISLWSPIDRKFYKIQFTAKTSEMEMKTREKKRNGFYFMYLIKQFVLR